MSERALSDDNSQCLSSLNRRSSAHLGEISMVGLNSLRRETQDDVGGEIVVSEHWKIGVSVVARNTIVFTRDLSLILHSCSI